MAADPVFLDTNILVAAKVAAHPGRAPRLVRFAIRECRMGTLHTGSRAGYTSGMKTAISLPDDVFHDAHLLAKLIKKSRSKLYREAVAEYLARHEPEAITDALNQLARRLDTRLDRSTSAATTRMLESSEW